MFIVFIAKLNREARKPLTFPGYFPKFIHWPYLQMLKMHQIMDCSHQFGGETYQCNVQIFAINMPNDEKEKSHILDQSANFE